MKKLNILSLILSVFLISSCEDFLGLVEDASDELSTEEVVKGLKTALEVGTDTAVSVTSLTNGYFKNEAIKLLLPEEAKVIYDVRAALIKHGGWLAEPLVDGIDKAIDDVVLTLNRAAEDAATEAKPIFKNAITGLTIEQGWDILNGTNPLSGQQSSAFDSSAATRYLESSTRLALFNAFEPKINTSLDKDLVGNLSANKAWNTFTTTYNNLFTNSIAKTALSLANVNIDPIELSLSEYATDEALEGLFFMVEKEEKKIRKDPWQWAVDIIQKVFGHVYQE